MPPFDVRLYWEASDSDEDTERQVLGVTPHLADYRLRTLSGKFGPGGPAGLIIRVDAPDSLTAAREGTDLVLRAYELASQEPPTMVPLAVRVDEPEPDTL